MRRNGGEKKGRGGKKKEAKVFFILWYLWVVYKRCPIAAGRVVARCDELERLDDCLHRLEQAGTEHACVILKFATAAVLLQSFAKRYIFSFYFSVW